MSQDFKILIHAFVSLSNKLNIAKHDLLELEKK